MATKRFQSSFLLPESWFPKYWTGSIVKTEYSKIEDEYDLQCYERAIKSYKEDPTTYTLDEVEKELGL